MMAPSIRQQMAAAMLSAVTPTIDRSWLRGQLPSGHTAHGGGGNRVTKVMNACIRDMEKAGIIRRVGSGSVEIADQARLRACAAGEAWR